MARCATLAAALFGEYRSQRQAYACHAASRHYAMRQPPALVARYLVLPADWSRYATEIVDLAADLPALLYDAEYAIVFAAWRQMLTPLIRR